ncbi:MAG: hypothetical protein E7158_03960 [Firmicutes bacterium]|nr:hypothetical protein [Bacillota bacterium]
MEKREIGRFYAISFNNVVYEFIVYDDNTINCPTLNINSIETIRLKPRFVLIGEKLHYELDVKPNNRFSDYSELIGNYVIDEELFFYLKVNRMIKYSTDMAYLYGFSDKSGFDDNRYGVGSPYKWSKKKGPILEKQKHGHFN